MNLDSRQSVDVKRIDDALIAAFHRATPPMVWRFDLVRNHTFSLALQGDEGEWELGLTSPKGDFQPVARFALREDAEEAFIKVERILSRHQTAWLKVSARILGIIALLLLIGILGFGLTVGHGVWQSFTGKSRGSDITSSSPAAIPAKPGSPVPADDFFGRNNGQP